MRAFITIVENSTSVQSGKTLVLVHPGSACGSADFNLGTTAARKARAGLVHELNGWVGNLVVIRSDLDDELPRYAAFNNALSAAIARNKAKGNVVIIRDGYDPEQVEVIRDLVESGALADQDFIVTGAWAGEGSGCATSVLDELHRLGQDARFSEMVLWE